MQKDRIFVAAWVAVSLLQGALAPSAFGQASSGAGAAVVADPAKTELARSVLEHHVRAMVAGAPDYGSMAPELVAKLRPAHELLELVKTFGEGVYQADPPDQDWYVFTGRHPTGRVKWRLRLTPDGKLRSFGLQDMVRVNADRIQNREKFLTYRAPYIDPIVPGQSISALFERSDGNSIAGMWKEDCYQIVAPPGQALKLSVYSEGVEAFAKVQRQCGYLKPELWSVALTKSAFGIRLITDGEPMYVWVVGRADNVRYNVQLDPISPQEKAQWQAEERQARLAEAQQREERAQALGQFVAGAVAVASVASVGGDVSKVPLNGNAYEIMTGANAEIGRQQQATQSRFEATLQDAQRQASGAGGAGQGSAPRNGGPARTSAYAAQSPGVQTGAQRAASTTQASQGSRMYGFCWATQTSAGDSPIYHSRIGQTDRYLNGATTDNPNQTWQSRMEAEFASQIGAHTGLICYANPSPNGFDYNISTNASGHRIIEVPWAPH